jgi:hypothetical protein
MRRAATASRPIGWSRGSIRSRFARSATTLLLPQDVAAEQTATVDLKLRKTKNLSAQLSNAEWMMSLPGTEDQKAFLLNCVAHRPLDA